MDIEKFNVARHKIINHTRERNGIGTLSEKTVHAILKHYCEGDETKHEIKIQNKVADIFTGEEILEIQTRSFYVMKKKLDSFLPLYPVTIVYPIPRNKWVIWIDEETGEFTNRRKSPVKGNEFFIFKELYSIKSYLKHEHIRFKIMIMDMEEYRLLNGWSKDKKRGSRRFDRIPMELIEEIDITCVQDYLQLLPYGMKEPFTVKDFAKEVHIKKELSSQVMNVMHYLELVERVGKKGNGYLYRVVE
ncbi:MAG: hypothetical protein R3Y24_11085 [Eubacteriales bacterium]